MTSPPAFAVPFAIPLAPLLSAGLCAGLIVLLMPWLARYALARPNARSSHAVPTPQGGGVAIVAATLTVAAALDPAPFALNGLGEGAVLALAALLLAGVGGIDDVRPLPAALRLALQALCVGAVVFSVDGRLLPDLPLPVERGLAILAGLWFVNLINFMDGLDWITVAEAVPVTGFLTLAALAGLLPVLPGLVAAALLGALLGFAPFNRPVARLFMGDVGSLPLGLILAWLLYRLALEGGLAAAVLLPLYPLADATLTLLWRLRRGERVWQAHRSHYYQVATVNGLPVIAVSGAVFALGLGLAGLAGVSLAARSDAVSLACLVAGSGLVGGLLAVFRRPRPGGSVLRAGSAGQSLS